MGIDWSRIVLEEFVNGIFKVVSIVFEMIVCIFVVVYNSVDVLYVIWLFFLGR